MLFMRVCFITFVMVWWLFTVKIFCALWDIIFKYNNCHGRLMLLKEEKTFGSSMACYVHVLLYNAAKHTEALRLS
jgi:hypothetical protein